MMRRMLPLVLFTVLATAPSSFTRLQAQAGGQINDLVAHPHAKAEPSTVLTLTGTDGKVLSLTPAELTAMPHTSVSVFNEHTKADETYTGVALTDLLAKVGVPVGKDLKGKAYRMYVLAEGTDHYTVLYSLDEVDGMAHKGDVIVADTLNGTPLTADGAFKLVSSEDKRPARWVRNLTAITVKVAE